MTDPEVDYWMWDIFFTYPSASTLTRSFTVTTPDVADRSFGVDFELTSRDRSLQRSIRTIWSKSG